MKKHKSIHIINRALIVFFAVFVSLFVSFNQSIQQEIQRNTVANNIPAQEDESQAPEAEHAFISSAAAIVPFFYLGAANATNFIFQLSSIKDTYVKQAISKPIYINVYLKTLFSRIISPNAP
jgi:flagellar basal body-associated protein FliL